LSRAESNPACFLRFAAARGSSSLRGAAAEEEANKWKSSADEETQKRRTAERAVQDASKTNIPAGASIEEAQEQLMKTKSNLEDATNALHTAIDTEHAALESAKQKAKEVEVLELAAFQKWSSVDENAMTFGYTEGPR